MGGDAVNGLKRLVLILYALASFVGVGYLACSYFSVTIVTEFVTSRINAIWLYNILLGCLCVLAAGLLIILLRAIFSRSPRETVRLRNEGGTCEIGPTAIDSVVRSALSQHAGIDHRGTDVRATSGSDPRVKLKVRANVGDVPDLASVTVKMQEEVKDAVEAFTGATVEDVSFKFKNSGSAKGASRNVMDAVAEPVQGTNAEGGAR